MGCRIARNIGNFEAWSTYQRCDQVSYSDVPKELKADISEVFDVTGKLPAAWIDKVSRIAKYLRLPRYATSCLEIGGLQAPEALRVTRTYSVHTRCCTAMPRAVLQPSQLRSWGWALCGHHNSVRGLAASPKYAPVAREVVGGRLCSECVGSRISSFTFSNKTLTSPICRYNLIRSPAIRESTHRVHCTVSLAQPSANFSRTTQAVRVLNTRTAIPDCGIFIPAASIRSLSHSAQSPFRVLKNHPTIVSAGSTSTGSSFRYQSTPCAQLPSTPGFEFSSSFWEDKKPLHQMLEDAYRQNRMSTASAVRQMHSLHINAPIFGLVWSNGTVRAHVDWCKDEQGDPVCLCSMQVFSCVKKLVARPFYPLRTQAHGQIGLTMLSMNGYWTDPATYSRSTS